MALRSLSRGEIVSSCDDRKVCDSCVRVRAKIRKPSFGFMENVEVTYKVFYSTRGRRNESRSEGVSSMLRKTSHKPYSAATVRGPFLKMKSPVSLQT